MNADGAWVSVGTVKEKLSSAKALSLVEELSSHNGSGNNGGIKAYVMKSM